MDNLQNSFYIAGAGLKVQGRRLKVIAQNIANRDSTSQVPGGDPYRRQIITFKNSLDRAMGVDMVQVGKITQDNAAFTMEYNPSHPGANEEGYVKLPNVNSLIEVTDMREAQRSYEANLGVIKAARTMISRTIELMG